jgi:hypothetical protein
LEAICKQETKKIVEKLLKLIYQKNKDERSNWSKWWRNIRRQWWFVRQPSKFWTLTKFDFQNINCLEIFWQIWFNNSSMQEMQDKSNNKRRNNFNSSSSLTKETPSWFSFCDQRTTKQTKNTWRMFFCCRLIVKAIKCQLFLIYFWSKNCFQLLKIIFYVN